MGALLALLRSATGQAGVHDSIGRWRLAVSAAVETLSGGTLTFQTETGTNLPIRPIVQADWFTVEDTGTKIILRPNSTSPRVTAAARADTNINIAAPPAIIDGYTLEPADVVWLTNQTNPAEDGFYSVNRAGGGFTAATALNAFAATSFAYVKVINGATYGGLFFISVSTGIVELPDPGLDWMAVDLDDFYLPADGTDHLPAWNRARYAGAGLVTLYRRPRYLFSDVCEANHKITVQGLSTIREPNLTECVFDGSSGFSALSAGVTLDSQGGYIKLRGLWIRYAGSNLEASDFHGLDLETQCIVEECTIENFPGHGIHSAADGIIAENANLCCSSCRVVETGLSGVYTEGSNNSSFVGVEAVRCGRRLFGVVRSRWSLRLTNTTGSNVNITAGNQVWKDTRRGLYFLSVDVGSGLIPSGGGTLDIVIEAYDGSLTAELILAGQDPRGAGTYGGYGTEYDLPSPNTAFVIGTISTHVYSLENLTGVTASNLSGTPSVPAILGDAHNFFDNTAQGCTYLSCVSKEAGVRHYLSIQFGGSTFLGCKCGAGFFGQVMPPNMRIGGFWSDPPGIPNNGLLRDTSGLATTNIIASTKSVTNMTVRIARALTNEILHFFTTVDTAGYKFQQGVGGRQLNSYCMEHAGASALCAIGFTQPTDQRGPGHTILPRGPIIGNAGFRISGASTPGTSGPPATSSATDVWNVSDIWFDMLATSGTPWMYRCNTKVGNALTWLVSLNAP